MNMTKDQRKQAFIELGSVFRHARQDLNISKVQAAQLLGFKDASTYENLESGNYGFLSQWSLNEFTMRLYAMGKALHFSTRDIDPSQRSKFLNGFTTEELRKALEQKTVQEF